MTAASTQRVLYVGVRSRWCRLRSSAAAARSPQTRNQLGVPGLRALISRWTGQAANGQQR